MTLRTLLYQLCGIVAKRYVVVSRTMVPLDRAVTGSYRLNCQLYHNLTMFLSAVVWPQL